MVGLKVLVAGPSGVVGRPTVRRLIEAGHEVVGLTRSEAAAEVVRSLGGTAVMGDLLDAASVLRAAEGVGAVVQIALALPTGFQQMKAQVAALERLTVEGTDNLLRASRQVGAQVYVHESVQYVYGDQGERWVDEETELPKKPPVRAALEAEERVRTANGDGLETVILRFGFVYARDAWHTQLLVSQARKRMLPIAGGGQGYWSLVHAEDAARAVVLAMEDAAGGAVYNVVDDEPVRLAEVVTFLAEQVGGSSPPKVPKLAVRAFAGKEAVDLLSGSIRLSNRLIRHHLGFEPAYPTYREGLAAILAEGVPELA